MQHWPLPVSGIGKSLLAGHVAASAVALVDGRSHRNSVLSRQHENGLSSSDTNAAELKMYSDDEINELRRQHQAVVADLFRLQLQCVAQSEQLESPRAREYLTHGVGRRVSIMRNALLSVFRLFPPDTRRQLDADDLTDAQVNLHAFVINLSGVLDNFAWAFVHRHQLEHTIGDRRGVSLFNERTSRYFPEPIINYLNAGDMRDWHDRYVKNYRDALAHRIPLYIPPMVLDRDEQARYEQLHVEMQNFFRMGRVDEIDELRRQRDAIGNPCFSFLHSYADEEEPRPVFLHPQMIADGMTIVEFGRIFLDHWEERRQ